VSSFVQRFLEPLKTYDLEHGSSLTQTLEAYLDSSGSTKLTSQILFTHYNTVTYRIDKIQSLLGLNIEDSDIRLQLQIALKLDRLLSQSTNMSERTIHPSVVLPGEK